MVKFLKVTLKKFKPQIINNELVGHDLDSMIQHEEDKVNRWLIKGFEIIHVIDIEDLRGFHLLFVLHKKPPVAAERDKSA